MERNRKIRVSTIIIIVFCVIGLSLLMYPTVADFWNTQFAVKSVNNYAKSTVDLTEESYQQMWTMAIEFNRQRAEEGGFVLPADLEETYYSLLNASGTGMMGYIEIPSINATIPLFHGTSDTVLASAVGHLEWSSLPTGGENTHCVLSGHRGLASARLFTDLNKVREGDVFILTVLNETLTYEVDQIRTVVPSDLSELGISEGSDLCTLVTCTPYGINTHRLLVRGHRVANTSTGANVISEAVLIDQLIVALFLAIPLIFTLFMIVMLQKPKKKVSPVPVLKEESKK